MVVENFIVPPIANASTRDGATCRNSVPSATFLGVFRTFDHPISARHQSVVRVVYDGLYLNSFYWIVRRKEWPHFFRFHVFMGMLLEIDLQVIGTVSTWMPLAFYRGKIGMHFWLATAFACLFAILECNRCALAGMYADDTFLCDAAYIQIPYN